MFETLLVERPAPYVQLIRFNRPAAANALSTQMGRELLTLFDSLLLESGDTRCIVLTGTGEKAFCAGGDLKERHGMTDAAWIAQHRVFEQAFYRVMDCPLPTIAAVNGAAYGGGCEIALACDFIYAASTARFAQTETRLGIIPGGGGTQTLARAIGGRRAKELIFAAKPFTATDAHEWGMVNRVLAPEQLLAATLELAKQIAANGPIAVRQAKRAISSGIETDLKTALALEIECYNATIATNDRREGVAAFNEGRAPQFQGS